MTLQDQIDNLKQAKPGYIWSGDVRRYKLVRKALDHLVYEKIIELEFVEDYEAQESGYTLNWLTKGETPTHEPENQPSKGPNN